MDCVKIWLEPNLGMTFSVLCHMTLKIVPFIIIKMVNSKPYVQIGSKFFPEYPIRSHREAYYQLAKTFGMQSNARNSFDISGPEYHQSNMAIGIDCEKVIEAGF